MTETEQQLKADLAAANQKIIKLEQAAEVHAKEKAEAAVNQAVIDCRLAPQATAEHERWVRLITKDPEAIHALNALPARTDLFKTIVPPVSGGIHARTSHDGGGQEHAFMVQARSVAKERNCDLIEAARVVATQNPALYGQYQRAHATTRRD